METNSNGEKQWDCWTEHRKWDLMRGKMKNRAICSEGWLSKDNLVSFQSFVSLLYSKSRKRLFPIVCIAACMCMCVCVWTYGCMCMCANRVANAQAGMFFPLCMLRAITYLSKCVSGSRQRSSPGPRPLESSACEGQVWFRERQGRLAWKWNLLSLCQTSRLTDCPQPLITSKSLLSSHRPLLLPSRPPLHTNMRLMHRRKSAEMGLFDNHDVKQCLHERETWIQLLVAARNHLLRAKLSLLIAFSFPHMADFARSHFLVVIL